MAPKQKGNVTLRKTTIRPVEEEEVKISPNEFILKTIAVGLQDSIEIGAPSKGGAMKCYIDASQPDVAREKLRNLARLRISATMYASAETPEQLEHYIQEEDKLLRKKEGSATSK